MQGGKREGAGRKQGFAAKTAEEARKLLSERVAQEIGPITDILIKLAKQGNIKAIHELLDRAWGRAPQEKDVIKKDSFVVNLVNFAGDMVDGDVAPQDLS